MTELASTIIQPEPASAKWRVKYYNLNETGEWSDCGTGYVNIAKEPEYQLAIANEVDDTVILELSLTSSIEFHLQRNTIITWSTSPENEDDRAISFQDIQGVKEVWDLICFIQGRNPYDIANGLCYENKDLLPEVTLNNLSLIENTLITELNPGKIKQINFEIMNNSGSFLYQLGLLFNEEEKKMEELKSNCSNKTSDTSSLSLSSDCLSLISSIMKHLLLIANRDLLLMIVTDKYYEIVFGALEFDSASFKVTRHREYFKSVANFRNILDITDLELLSKIHLNHRLAYLRDTAAGRFIEETSFNNINLIIQANNSSIIRFFLLNEKMLTSIIEKINQSDLLLKKDATSFLVDLINCSQNILQLRIQFLELLCSVGILKTIEDLIYSMRSNAFSQLISIINSNVSQILINLLSFAPFQLKTYIMTALPKQQNSKRNSLLTEISFSLLQQNDFSVQYEIGEIIKALLDNDSFSCSMISYSVQLQVTEGDVNPNTFFEVILNYCLLPLSEYLLSPIETFNPAKRNEQTTTKQIIIEVLNHCLTQHGRQVVFWFIDNQILSKVLSVLKNSMKILDLQVVKFTKSAIAINDNHLNYEVIQTNCLQKVLLLFKENRKKQNIIFSAILNLFETVKASPSSNGLINNMFQHSKDLIYEKSICIYFKELIELYEADSNRSGEHNEDTLSFIGLFPSGNERNEEDNFDLVQTTPKFLGKKTRHNKESINEDMKFFS